MGVNYYGFVHDGMKGVFKFERPHDYYDTVRIPIGRTLGIMFTRSKGCFYEGAGLLES